MVPGGPPATADDVVTCFLRHRGEVLLVRRSGGVGSYRGRWGAISGFVEEDDPLQDALREIAEETGLEGAVRLVKRGEPFAFVDEGEGRRWRVHPFLFDADSREARLDWEAREGVWVSPAEILARETVPRLWTSYARVAPSVADIRQDRSHGSAWLSLRAVEALRDRAAALAAAGAGATAADELKGLARELGRARPAMTALANRVARVAARSLAAEGAARGAAPDGPDAEGDGAALARRVRDEADAVLQGAIRAEEATAAEVGRAVAGRRVLTLSYSGTVADGLRGASPAPAEVVVCESRPGGEGRTLAAGLAAAGIPTVLVPDAAVAWALEAEAVALVLVGADTVFEDGSVVNKVGTRAAALAARAAGVRVLAAAASDKVAAAGEAWSPAAGETSDGEAPDAEGGAAAAEATAAGVEGGPRPATPPTVRRRAPLFERTPGALVDALVTEHGELTREQLATVAAAHARDRRWDRGGP